MKLAVIKQNGKVMSCNLFGIFYDIKEQGENSICIKPNKAYIIPSLSFKVYVGEIHFVISVCNCVEHSEMRSVLPLSGRGTGSTRVIFIMSVGSCTVHEPLA